MPPPTKRQRKDSAGSGALHEDESGRFLESCLSAVLGRFLRRENSSGVS